MAPLRCGAIVFCDSARSDCAILHPRYPPCVEERLRAARIEDGDVVAALRRPHRAVEVSRQRISMKHNLVLFSLCCAVSLATVPAAHGADLPPNVLAKNRWMELTRGDYDAALAKVPEKLRWEFATSPKRLQDLLNGMLVTKTLAAQARAHGAQAGARAREGSRRGGRPRDGRGGAAAHRGRRRQSHSTRTARPMKPRRARSTTSIVKSFARRKRSASPTSPSPSRTVAMTQRSRVRAKRVRALPQALILPPWRASIPTMRRRGRRAGRCRSYRARRSHPRTPTPCSR